MKETWKVLLADDEPRMWELIQRLVPWEKMGLEVAAKASNGLEAIETLKHTRIHILITDARMPECDGIGLVKWCRENCPEVKCVVISGYRLFEYAHGALQYGVDRYLLKPISQKELIQCLEELTAQLEEAHQARSHSDIQQQIHRSQGYLQQHFARHYLFDGEHYSRLAPGPLEEINEEYQMHFHPGGCQTALFQLAYLDELDVSVDKLLSSIKTHVDSRFAGLGWERVSVKTWDGVLLLVNYDLEREKEFRQHMGELCEDLERLVDVFERLYINIGVGARLDGLDQLPWGIATARDALTCKAVTGRRGPLYYDDFSFSPAELNDIWTVERRTLMESCAKRRSRDAMLHLVRECRFAFSQMERPSPVLLFQLADAMGRTAADVLEDPEDRNRLMLRLKRQLRVAGNQDDVWTALEQTIDRTVSMLGEQLQFQLTRPVRSAKEYIAAHFREPVTLDALAEYAGLSANYFSAIFKKETGLSFVDYLAAVRMEEATRLLRTTNAGIREIANQVGYQEIRHFNRLFKKSTGMKPSEYRKLYS